MKFFFLAVTVFMLGTIGAGAQSFHKVKEVSKVDNAYVAIYDIDKWISISASDYMRIKDAPAQYFVASYRGEKSFNIIVNKSEFTDEMLVVDSMAIDDDCNLEVIFTNGTSHKKANEKWLEVLYGQKVRHTVIKSKTRNFESYEALVSDELPLGFVANKMSAPKITKPTAQTKPENQPKGKTTTYTFSGSQVRPQRDKNSGKKQSYSGGGFTFTER